MVADKHPGPGLRRRGGRRRRGLVALGVASAVGAMVAGCSPAAAPAGVGPAGIVDVVAAENEYGSVAAQIGGSYVRVTSIMSNPNTDPHTYEVSPSVVRTIAAARIVIQNGLGYDTFMHNIEAASSSSGRQVIDVQQLRGLPDSTPNPHLWYDPATMPAVAHALAADLAAVDPSHASYFQANAARFVTSLRPWRQAIKSFQAAYPSTTVAVTEPVADDLLQALGADIETPFSLQADIMNGVDPAPQDLDAETELLRHRKVEVLVYNQQVTDTVTEGFINVARAAGVPVVGVYETMPVPGYDYQSWMQAEVAAVRRAVVTGASTQKL